jgi:hypothetical protein
MVLTAFSVFLAVFAVRLPWRKGYPVYLISLALTGFGAAFFNNTLVAAGYLEFPWRLLPEWTTSNVVYDFWLLPAVTLLLVDRAVLTGRTWLYAGIYLAAITVTDGLVIRHTELLVFRNWTLIHTAVGAAVMFAVTLVVYRWLWRYFRRDGFV